jgi:hypothetical protein
VGPKDGLDDIENLKFLTLPGHQLRSRVRQARSQLLYRLLAIPTAPPLLILLAASVFILIYIQWRGYEYVELYLPNIFMAWYLIKLRTTTVFNLNMFVYTFVFVGCILLRYLHILYKYTTQKLHICDPQTQLTTSLLFQNLTTCFGPFGPSSGDIFEDSHSTATHLSFLQV